MHGFIVKQSIDLIDLIFFMVNLNHKSGAMLSNFERKPLFLF